MPEPAARRSVRRWWNRVTATILALGALAGAIGAILALRPAPDPEDSARFTAVRVTSQIPLSEYQERLAAMVPQGAGSGGRQDRPVPVRRLQPDPSANSQADPTAGTSAPDPSSSSSDTTASSETTSSTPETTSQPTSSGLGTASSVEINPPARFGQEEFRAHVEQVIERVREREPIVEEFCQARPPPCYLPMIHGISIGEDGKPVEPEVAAERVVELLRDTRRTSGDGSGAGEPLGVVVTADLDLIGLRGRPVLLSWQMWQQGGAKRLHGNWLNTNLAYHLEAESEHDSTTQNIWIPLPKSAGPYFIRVLLGIGEAPLTSADSQPFD